MFKDELPPPPSSSALDHSLTVAKGVAIAESASPTLAVAGAAATAAISIIETAIAPFRAKQIEEWNELLWSKVRELGRQYEALLPEQLAENEAFAAAVRQATHTAMKTRQKEKLEALRNAVVNIGIGSALDDHYETFLLALCDSLTATHILMLKQFEDGRSLPINAAPDWLKSNVASQIAMDLFDRGLLRPGVGHTVPLNRDRLIIGENSIYSFHTVPSLLGEMFLNLIREPK